MPNCPCRSTHTSQCSRCQFNTTCIWCLWFSSLIPHPSFKRHLPFTMSDYGVNGAPERPQTHLLVLQYGIVFALTTIVTITCNTITYRFVSKQKNDNDTTVKSNQSLARMRKAMVTAGLQFVSTTCLQVHMRMQKKERGQAVSRGQWFHFLLLMA